MALQDSDLQKVQHVDAPSAIFMVEENCKMAAGSKKFGSKNHEGDKKDDVGEKSSAALCVAVHSCRPGKRGIRGNRRRRARRKKREIKERKERLGDAILVRDILESETSLR